MKNQRFVFGTIVQSNGVLMFQDSNGAMFNIPALNEKGTSLYRRALQASKRPDKFRFKIRVKGSFTSGELCFGRVPASKATDTTPVMNFNKPNGGLEQYAVDSVHKPTVTVVSTPAPTAAPVVMPENVLNFIHSEAAGLKPKMLFMPELKWKYLIRNILRGKNIMMTGAAGCGKTMAAKAAASSIDGYSTFIINLGATQDPRTTLIGNTQYDTAKGTVFNQSPFVKAIQTPNTVVVLDEITRAHPEAWNILMTVLDPGQRYLRLDEAADAPTINVADGVSFIASANIGNEYTATRLLDRAILDRFTIIEMDSLTRDEESTLLGMMYPSVSSELLGSVAEITAMTRDEVRSESPKLTNSLSTRTAVEIGSLLYDGFSLTEAAEIAIYPFFDNNGGAQSERVFMKQFVQKFVKTGEENLFNTEDTVAVNNPF
jgi:nitric oxide reductase NorQ protein